MDERLKVEYVGIDTIKPYKRNAKLHPEEQVEQIKRSMLEMGDGDALKGFLDPIGVWNGEIVEGHGRYLAAKELGLDTVPIIRLDELTDEQRRAYGLIHNQLTMNSGFDIAMRDLELGDLELDMSAFGFELEQDEDYGTEFDLPDGDRAPVQNMTFTFSDDEAEVVKGAIAAMKQSKSFERYENPLNENGNGKALFLVVSEWQARKT